ncbi:MAG: hypothetical protein AABX33_07845 [Nanoarchaeota archaeon]
MHQEKFYRPKKFVGLSLILLIILTNVITFNWYTNPEHSKSKYCFFSNCLFHFKVNIIFGIIFIIITILWNNTIGKWQPIIEIFKNQVSFIPRTKGSSEITLSNQELKNIQIIKTGIPKIIGIEFKDIDKISQAMSEATTKTDLIYKIIHYISFKLRKIPIKFLQFNDKKEDKIYIFKNIMEINHKRGYHVSLWKISYSKQFDSLYNDLSNLVN